MRSTLGHHCCGAMATVLLMLAISPLSSAQIPNADCSYLIAGRTFAQLFDGYFNSGLLENGGGVLPNAGGGVLTFHPHGRLTGKLTLTVGQLFEAQDVPLLSDSNYSLEWDTTKHPILCTGTATTDDIMSGPHKFQLVVSSDGTRVEMFHTDFGLALGVSLNLMPPGRCNNRSLQSTYSYNAKGWMVPPPPPDFPAQSATQLLNDFMPFAFSGAIKFDPNRPAPSEPPDAPPGSAYLEGWDTVSLNGVIVPRTYTGWYLVNADCTSTQAFVDGQGHSTHVEAFVTKEGTLQIVNVDPVEAGLVLAFTAKR